MWNKKYTDDTFSDQFLTLLLIQILLLNLNFFTKVRDDSIEHLQRVRHLNRGRFLLRTHDPVPLWDLQVFQSWDQSLLNLSCVQTFEFRTSLGTSVLLLLICCCDILYSWPTSNDSLPMWHNVFAVSCSLMADTANQLGYANSPWVLGLKSGLQGSMNVHHSTLRRQTSFRVNINDSLFLCPIIRCRSFARQLWWACRRTTGV